MSKVLIVNVINLLLRDFAPASWTLLVFGHLVLDHISELIFLDLPLEEPVTVQTDQVEPMEALVNADEVYS